MTNPTQEDDVKAILDALANVTFHASGATSYFVGDWADAANPARIARLLAHIDAQAVRLDAAELDAARYRCVRDALDGSPAGAEFWPGIRLTFRNMQEDSDWCAMADDNMSLDDAIDAHIAAIASEAKT